MGSKFQKYFASIARGFFFLLQSPLLVLDPISHGVSASLLSEGVLLELYFCKVMMLRCVFFWVDFLEVGKVEGILYRAIFGGQSWFGYAR